MKSLRKKKIPTLYRILLNRLYKRFNKNGTFLKVDGNIVMSMKDVNRLFATQFHLTKEETFDVIRELETEFKVVKIISWNRIYFKVPEMGKIALSEYSFVHNQGQNSQFTHLRVKQKQGNSENLKTVSRNGVKMK